MKKNAQTLDAAQQGQPAQGFHSDVRAFLSRDGEYLTLVLPGNMRVTKHKNWYLSLLKQEWTPKAAQRSATAAAPAEAPQG